MATLAMAADPGRELLILGILRRGPVSAYTLARAVKMHGPLYTALARGNLYELLGGLERRGMVVRSNAPSQRGPRREKTIYGLSAAGRRRFEALLSKVLNDAQAPDPSVEVACVLLGALPRERAAELLRGRLQALVAHEKRLGRLFGNPEERSASGLLAMEHAAHRVRAEIEWTQRSLANVLDPKWKSSWVASDESTAETRRLP